MLRHRAPHKSEKQYFLRKKLILCDKT